jgi:hypothetical protein
MRTHLKRGILCCSLALALLGAVPAHGAGDPTETPPVLALQARTTVRITSITSPISIGSTARLVASTSAGASCSIRYVTGKGTVSKAQGLTAQKADQKGTASWAWKIGTGTAPGTGNVTVTCGGVSASTKIVVR